MTSGIGAQPDQYMPTGPLPYTTPATNAAPGFAASAATTQNDYQTQMRDALLNTLGLGQLVQLCNILNGLPFVASLRSIGDQITNGATGSVFQGIGNLIDPLTTAVSAFIHTYDNIDWNNPATIIPTILRDVITSTWNLFWAIIKWAIYVISVITSMDITKGTKFLSDLANFLEFSKLQAAFNTLFATWETLDFAGNPLVALPEGFVAFGHFIQAVWQWALDVINKLLGITFPGWFSLTELGNVWTTFKAALSAITWTAVPAALLAFVAAAIKALQGLGNWMLSVGTHLIGSDAPTIHTMFADPVTFLNQMITYFFGTAGLTKWTDALNWMTSVTGATPIAALNALYAQLRTLGDLFGQLANGDMLGALTTFFTNFSNNFASFPVTLQNSLTSLFTAASDIASSVMQQVMSIIGNLSVSNLVGTAQNLLLNPGFSSAISLSDPNNLWTWDDTVFLTGIGVAVPGSARITASGVVNALRSNTIAVTAGKTLNMAINVLSNGLVGTGTPLLLQAITEAGTTTIASSAAPSGSPAAWTGAPPTAQAAVLSGSYTVPSSGVSKLTLRLVLDATATAGTVWWDGANLAATGLVAPTLVGGIGGTPNIGSALQQTWDTVSNAGANLGTLPLITQRLQNLSTAGIFNATGVTGIGGIPNIAAALQQTWDNIANTAANNGTLALIAQRLQNLGTTGLFNAAQLTNIANIPALNIGSVTNLTGYLTNLTTSGLLNAGSGLSGVVPIGQIPTASLNKTNITDLGTTYTAAKNAGAVGASMSRRATGTVTVTANTAAYILTSYYDTTDTAASGITSIPASAQFNVTTTGWYRCDICFKVAGQFSAIWMIAPVLFKNSGIYKLGHDAISYSFSGSGVTQRWIHSSFQVQLNAGDTVNAGIIAQNATGTISNVLTGESTGSEAYFTIALLNQQVT